MDADPHGDQQTVSPLERDQRHYSGRELRFVLAHLEEYAGLDEGGGEASRTIQEALQAEWARLDPEQPWVCDCEISHPIVGVVGNSRSAAKAPSATLLDLKRAYDALPLASTFRTVVYLQLVPTHSSAIRHLGEPCDAAFEGDGGHLVRHTSSQVWEMSKRDFEARHKRRIAIETLARMGKGVRAQDSWPELHTGGYRYMADYLNLGERAFLERGPQYVKVEAAA